MLAAIVVACSAIVVKEHGSTPPLVNIDQRPSRTAFEPEPLARPELTIEQVSVEETDENVHVEIRWFDGRPVRPARTIWMTVTAYSPDARSCGPYADGKTATLHSVWTNAMQLVAADPRVLPYGSMVSVPGYAQGDVVPVLDCGQAIRGHRLDVLFPTHAQARKWGRQRLAVTLWEYADGLPAPNPRKVR